MIQKKWFRIETDSEGNILSCEEVSSKGRQGAVVRYYEALDKADACKQAKEWANRYRETKRSSMNARRREREANGLCVYCGVRPSASAQSCRECVALNTQRSRELRLGRVPRISRLSDTELRERVRDRKRQEQKLVAERWGSSRAYARYLDLVRLDRSGPEAFREDLCDRIRKAGGGAALDEYERERAKLSGDNQAEAAE